MRWKRIRSEIVCFLKNALLPLHIEESVSSIYHKFNPKTVAKSVKLGF